MFEEMKTTSYMEHATMEGASLGQQSQILRIGTSNGAKALRINAGMLVAGKAAIVVNLKDIMFTPLLKELKEER
jgi:5-methylthioadenosine/S-adenosylhomocysteine deaminase